MGLILARYFNFEALGTNFRTETTAGVTTYMTMVYIVFLQPAVLSQAGMDFGSVMMATCLSAALASFVMGVYANYPIGLAPGMGENFFFAITVVLGMGVSWQAALACVFASGVIFILLAIVRLREMIIDSIPASLKAAIATGIGLFIAFIGLVHAGIVKGPPTEVAALGDLHSPPVLLAGAALLLTAALMHHRIKGAILIGMIAALAAALIFKIVPYEGILSMPPSIEPTLFKLDLAALFSSEMIVVIIVFLFMDLFDTTGTLLAVSQQAGLLRNGKLPRASRALLADAVGTTFGALVGTIHGHEFHRKRIWSAGGREVRIHGSRSRPALSYDYLLLPSRQDDRIWRRGGRRGFVASNHCSCPDYCRKHDGSQHPAHKVGKCVGGNTGVPHHGRDTADILDSGRVRIWLYQLSGADAAGRKGKGRVGSYVYPWTDILSKTHIPLTVGVLDEENMSYVVLDRSAAPAFTLVCHDARRGNGETYRSDGRVG